MQDLYWMERALELAQKGAHLGEIPVGAIITRGNELLVEAHNQKELDQDPTGHAEVLAIRKASAYLKNWRLSECTMYVTLEPCLMCVGAIVAARFERVVIGARDPKAGAIISTYNFLETKHFNHYPKIEMDVLADKSSELLKTFFQNLRLQKKS